MSLSCERSLGDVVLLSWVRLLVLPIGPGWCEAQDDEITHHDVGPSNVKLGASDEDKEQGARASGIECDKLLVEAPAGIFEPLLPRRSPASQLRTMPLSAALGQAHSGLMRSFRY